MTMRMTKQHVKAKIDIVNGMLGGSEIPEQRSYNTLGAVRLYEAYGGYGVHRVMNDAGGVTELAGIGTLREAAQFLSGMIAALHIARDEKIDA